MQGLQAAALALVAGVVLGAGIVLGVFVLILREQTAALRDARRFLGPRPVLYALPDDDSGAA